MNELREAIFEEVYAGRNGDVYEDCYEATDRIIALVREALLSDDAISELRFVGGVPEARAAMHAALAAAGIATLRDAVAQATTTQEGTSNE